MGDERREHGRDRNDCCDCCDCCERECLRECRERCCRECCCNDNNGGLSIIWILVIIYIIFCCNNDGRGGLFGGLF